MPHFLGSASKTRDKDEAEQAQQKEQRDAGRRFRTAHVNVRLAQQWAAGQPWAELDIRGVPWSQDAAAAAECTWLKVRHTRCHWVKITCSKRIFRAHQGVVHLHHL